MEKSYKYSLKHILLIVLIFSLLLVQVSSEVKYMNIYIYYIKLNKNLKYKLNIL